MRPPSPPLLVLLALVAGLEGLGFLGYAAFDIVEAFRVGITGPAEVSNPSALIGLIAITGAFGAGLLGVAWGWWNRRSWARAPFIVAQLIIGLVSYEVTSSASSTLQTLGQAGIVVAIVGIVVCFLPSVRRAIADEQM